MKLIDNDELRVREMACVTFLCKHDSEALRCGDKEDRACAPKFRPISLGCISRAEVHRQLLPQAHAADWSTQILLDVVGECAQRRNVNTPHTRNA